MFGATLLSTVSVWGLGTCFAAFIGYLIERAQRGGTDPDELRLNRKLERFGSSMTISQIRRTSILTGITISLLILVVMQNVVFAFFPVVIGIVVPIMYPGRLEKKYMAKFDEGFAECLEIWARCVQSGLSLQQAVGVAANDLKGPVSREMDILGQQIRLGDVDGALWELYDRMPTDDVRYAVLGVITCRQTGGRISEVVAAIAEAIRERAAQREKIMALTSMGRTEAYIMAGMPFAVGFMMYLLEPETVLLLFNTAVGIIGTIVAIGWESIGLLVIWKIVDIKA